VPTKGYGSFLKEFKIGALAPEAMDRSKMTGFLFALAAFVTWGILPIYWKLLKEASPMEILSHRIVWSFLFVMLILYWRKRPLPWKGLKRKDLLLLFLTGTLVGLNWLIYIFAVNSDQIIEASMGYYINPLLSIMLGMIVLKERLDKLKIAGFVLAIIGVLYITVDYGKLPWIALSLATLFATYGLLKKMSKVEPMQALGMEVLYLSPLALGFILFIGGSGEGHFIAGGIVATLLLAFAGVVTTLPLYWFAEGARRIDLSSVGFMQFIAPSMGIVIGVFIYGEDFTTTHLVSFGCIWIALALYSISLVREFRTLKR
jgi:chloramphenicol-sensitive protein RarD